MKSKFKYLVCTAIMILIHFFVHSQEKLDLSIGFTFPEGFYTGVRYHYAPDNRIDFRIGSDLKFTDGKQYGFLMLNHAFYFGKINQKIEQKCWSFNTGILFSHSDNNHKETSSGILKSFIARDFAVSNKIIVQPELGVNYLLFNNSRIKDGFYEGYIIRFFPMGGVNLIFRL